ncbi:ANK [Seminavis robusta]|uniref:ANK n=1 Tax=Seminavis robusta TaxID=568900 RepID=A0A9N8H8J1_9STRA|nr:ANK [Seminavis robusta]|eukprot:Sro171_g075650.1 ANK (385) ;mRNA; r:9826-11091
MTTTCLSPLPLASIENLSSVSESSDYPFHDDDDDEEDCSRQEHHKPAKKDDDDNVSLAVSLGALVNDTRRGVDDASNRSLPLMQFEFDMGAGAARMSEDDNKSMKSFMMRMNSTNNLSYFQDAPEKDGSVPVNVNVMTSLRHQTSRDDLALTDTGRAPSPHSLFLDIIKGITGIDLPDTYWKNYFEEISDERVQAYSMETVRAARNQDVEALTRIYKEKGKGPLEACNKQGESIVHLACRRRNDALVSFLVGDAKVSLHVRDDWGKTPLHELCWNSRARSRGQFDSFRLLLKEAPELLFAKDSRGFTPLQYVPKESWKDWQRFLERYKKLIRCKVQLIGFVQSRTKLQETLERANSTMTLLSSKTRLSARSSLTKLSGETGSSK